MTIKIKFAKTEPTAIIPSKHEENMGYDLYACFDEDYIKICPNEVKLIPTGVATAFDKRYGMIIKERGSTGINGMSVRAGVIDSGYRGEIFVAINNTGSKPIIITKKCGAVNNVDEKYTFYPYEKAIAQIVLLPVPTVDIEVCAYSELLSLNSKRGVGILGSSGK